MTTTFTATIHLNDGDTIDRTFSIGKAWHLDSAFRCKCVREINHVWGFFREEAQKVVITIEQKKLRGNDTHATIELDLAPFATGKCSRMTDALYVKLYNIVWEKA